MPRAKKIQTDESISENNDAQLRDKKTRNVAPKEPITLIIDAARSSIKFAAIFRGQVIDCPKLPSVFAELENPLHQELGAFSVGLKTKKTEEDKKIKDEVKHYVVGDRAQLEINQTAMTQGHNHKIDYFYLLALGAISSIPDLYELSTGASEKSRTLTLKMVVLSLSDGKALLDQLKQCRWIKVNGVKYQLNFLLNHSLYFAEGYGSAVWAKKQLSLEPLDPKKRDVTVFDIGYGTACQTDYVCNLISCTILNKVRETGFIDDKVRVSALQIRNKPGFWRWCKM